MPLDINQAYQQIANFDTPNPMQQAVWDQIYNSADWGVGLLLKGPTGSGKTEAVAVPTLAQAGDNKRRLIMVYPTRSLVDDQIGRFEKMLEALSKYRQQTLTLVVDTGAQSTRSCWRNGDKENVTGNSRRHLYQGDVIITTLDKFLFRFFGFGEPKKSYIYPLRIHYGAKKTLVCFDEAHAYDDIAFTNFNRLVKTMYQKGLDVVLMTATMPQSFAEKFEYLETVNYVDGDSYGKLEQFVRNKFPDRKHPQKQLSYIPSLIEEPESDAVAENEVDPDFGNMMGDVEVEKIITPAPFISDIVTQVKNKHSFDKRLIVTVEKVTDAVHLYKQFKEKGYQPLLYHGRLTGERRTEVYNILKNREDTKQGYLLVSTSAIEVGCDLDAHLLITQLCDPDRLIQRIGRCNRKQTIADAQVIVVGDAIPEWLTSFTNSEDLNKYITELNQQNGQPIDVQALISCIQKVAQIDYHVEMMFDMLYDYVYEAKLENKGLHDKGLLFTRSWEPTVTLCTGEGENAVEVPVSRCFNPNQPLTPCVWLYKNTFNQRDHKKEEKPLTQWESAYAIDLVAVLQMYDFDKEVGYVDLPVIFNSSYNPGYRRVLVREDENGKSKLWYLNKLDNSIKMLVTDVVKEPTP